MFISITIYLSLIAGYPCHNLCSFAFHKNQTLFQTLTPLSEYANSSMCYSSVIWYPPDEVNNVAVCFYQQYDSVEYIFDWCQFLFQGSKELQQQISILKRRKKALSALGQSNLVVTGLYQKLYYFYIILYIILLYYSTSVVFSHCVTDIFTHVLFPR